MQSRILSVGWRLKQIDPVRELDADVLREVEQGDWGRDWLEVGHMPAMVHDVLLSHHVIETPWLPGRAEACRWVAERDWVYALRFAVGDPSAQHFLRFNGLDTIADVYLNGERIAQQSNAFMPLRVDVSGRLQDANALVLHFRTVFDPKDRSIVRLVDGDLQRPVRRQQNSYNTYLGPQPYYSRVGVYDDVVLEAVGTAEMSRLVVDAALSEDLHTGMVIVEVEGVSYAEELVLDVRLLAPDGSEVARASTPISDCRGTYRAEATIRVHDPELWWPRGYGGQPLYQVEVTLQAEGKVEQCEVRTIGFRRITMPEMLHFEVNGVPVRLWGGNWVSPDWVTMVWNPERGERLFDMAEHARFNALRVWGEVEAPDDRFYELADRRGFLLWQDFTVLPLRPDEHSRAICRQESAHLIRRLKHHPSILLWCGGNEAAMWNEREFGGPGGEWPGRVPAEQDVGAVCAELDPARFYLPNSPYYGIDPNDPKEGDTHGYTNMWYVPGYDDLAFASEDTRIAAPPLHSLKRFFAPQDLWPEEYSPVYRHGDQYPWPDSWMKYTTSSSWKKTGPVEQFYDATHPGELVYRLGMAEALYYQATVERQRRGRPAGENSERRICGGYLVWKYNDSWPQIYSGKVDYFLEPYIPYYAIRRAYAPVLLSFEVGTYVWLWAVNDSPVPVEGEATIQLFHLPSNQVVAEIVRPVRVEPDRSTIVARLDQAGIGTFYRDHVLYACLRNAEGQVIARANAFADIERRITFPKASLDVQVVRDGALSIVTDRFARSVYLEGDRDSDAFGWFFEDNWFDLLPGECKVVRVLGEHVKGRITARAWYSPYVTAVDWQKG